MDDTLVRLLVVLGAAAVVIVVAVLAKARSRQQTRDIPATGLDSGIYLLSSGGCGECETARVRLERMVGTQGFTEVSWDSEPELFTRLRITEVPSTLVVTGEGAATWHRGVPSKIADPGNP